MSPRQNGGPGDDPTKPPECWTIPTFSCRVSGPSGCVSGKWTCPQEGFSILPGGRILSRRQDQCLQAQHKLRAQCIANDGNYSYDPLDFCAPPTCKKKESGGLGGFIDGLVSGFTSGNPLQILQSSFGVVFPAVSLPLVSDESLVERLVVAGGESVGVEKRITQAALSVGELVLTGGGKSFADEFLKGVKPVAPTSIWEDIGSGIGDFFSGLTASDVLNVAAPIVTSLVAPPRQQMAPRPAQSFVPSYQTVQYGYPQDPFFSSSLNGVEPHATPVQFGGVARMVAPILAKIGDYIGRNVSLHRALSLARSLGRQLASPGAAAAALGITLAELAQLIVAGQHRRRRRMNPANVSALRRSARRIESFHRLCARTDRLRSRGRRRPVAARCGTCRKNPCRC